MDIKGFGTVYIEELVRLGYLKDVADIYDLKDHREELIEQGIIGKEKNTDKLLDAIEKSKENDAYKLLTGLGIPNVGKAAAKAIMKYFKDIAEGLGMNCLFEAHNEEELKSILKCSPKVVGINNRNLKTFEVSLENTVRLSKMIPDKCLLVSESGIAFNDDMKKVKSAGADAVLIGETLMRSGNISDTMASLRKDV